MKRQDDQQGGGARPEELRPGPERYFYGQWDRRTQQTYRRYTDYPRDYPRPPGQYVQHEQNHFAATHPYPHTVGDEGRYGSQHDMPPHDAWRPGEYVGWRENFPHQPARQDPQSQYPVQHAGAPGDLGRAAGHPPFGYGREAGTRYVQPEPSRSEYDPDYHQWREAQLRQLDDDYDRWRKERYSAFAEEFNRWRAGRRQQREPGGSQGEERKAAASPQAGTVPKSDKD